MNENDGGGVVLYNKEGETNKEKRYLKESIKYIVFLILKEVQINQNKNIPLPNISKNKLGREILLLFIYFIFYFFKERQIRFFFYLFNISLLKKIDE